MDDRSRALVGLGRALRARNFRFTTVTPETHRRVLARPSDRTDLRSIFGWNRPFAPDRVDPEILELLQRSEALEETDEGLKSKLRFATIGELLFVHSGFPTIEQDAVFFGPDTYRFVRTLRAALAASPPARRVRLIDIGSGSGAGGLFASSLLGSGTELVLADINPRALAFGAVNAVLNGIQADSMLSDVLAGVSGDADLIIANPPYLVDAEQRTYRHGGGEHGVDLAVRVVAEALDRLKPRGRLILYTGTPIIGGSDPFLRLAEPILQLQAAQYSYEEIDPDVFGEELERPAYANADRIAAICLTATKQG